MSANCMMRQPCSQRSLNTSLLKPVAILPRRAFRVQVLAVGPGPGGPQQQRPAGQFRGGAPGSGGGGTFRTSTGVGVRTVPRGPRPDRSLDSDDDVPSRFDRQQRGGRGGNRGGQQTLVPINRDIRFPEVRVIGEEREQKGVMATSVALDMARDLGVDLVLVVPDANPPVCRLISYSKYKYELEKADKDKKKQQRESRIDTKELKLRPNTDTHDYDVKLRQAAKFLSKGDRVKVTLQFKGREMDHREMGQEMFKRLLSDLGSEAVVEQAPSFQGRSMNMVLAPKKVVPA